MFSLPITLLVNSLLTSLGLLDFLVIDIWNSPLRKVAAMVLLFPNIEEDPFPSIGLYIRELGI